MKAVIPFLLIFVFNLAAVAAENPKSTPPSAEVILKIQVFKTGKIKADGAEISSAELAKKLDRLKEKKGVVWYYREAASEEPPPQATEIVKMIIARKLPVSMSAKTDFSDYVDEQGKSRPRKK
jgi:hypothetical protein